MWGSSLWILDGERDLAYFVSSRRRDGGDDHEMFRSREQQKARMIFGEVEHFFYIIVMNGNFACSAIDLLDQRIVFCHNSRAVRIFAFFDRSVVAAPVILQEFAEKKPIVACVK